MTLTTAPTAVELAELIDKAAAVIAKNGHHKRWLYSEKQAATGLPLADCKVDIIGALNIGAHGSPRYGQSRLVAAAERALLARIEAPSLVTWNDARGREADDAIDLLERTAAQLRKEAA